MEITKLKEGEIFVFGSNLAGRHGAGAAKTAVTKFGAIYGQGIGLQGQSYGIPTKSKNLKSLPLEEIEKYVNEFIDFAKNNKDKIFYVTRIGCGLAGYTDNQIKPMFIGKIPNNVVLPTEWL